MPIINTSLVTLGVRLASWWKSYFVYHPGHERRAREAFAPANNGDALGKALVCCEKCLEVEDVNDCRKDLERGVTRRDHETVRQDGES